MRILVVGDVMVDRYTYVRTDRFAPEMPGMPVWDQVYSEDRLGGAANVAANVIKLMPGADVSLAGIIEDVGAITDLGINADLTVWGETMVKHRFVDHWTNRYVMRHDNMSKFPEVDIGVFQTSLERCLSVQDYDAVILSDYDKGTIGPVVADIFRKHPLTIVDSKRRDLQIYDGYKVLKINESEYSTQVSSDLYPCFERFFEHCVVTKGAKGSELRQCEVTKSNDRRYMVHSEQFPTTPVQAVDVTGCGDTHTAAMTVALLQTNGDVRTAIRFANERAGEVVTKFGTCTV